MGSKTSTPDISIVFPCRDEEASLAGCIQGAQAYFEKYNCNGEIIVSDSSIDDSPNIAQKLDVTLIRHNKPGYGRAYLEALPYIRGTHVLFVDSDGSYNMDDIDLFVQKLNEGNDMVLGNRFAGGMDSDAMPFLNRYIGNPVLSFIFRLFFRVPYQDIHCGMRGFKRTVFDKMNLHTTGMEFASEVILEAVRNDMSIAEVPIQYHKRLGNSKLRPFADGWRHLSFMLLYSPTYLFFLPGIILSLLGVSGLLWFSLVETTTVFGFNFYFHPIFIVSLFSIVGVQTIGFGLFAVTYSHTHFNMHNAVFLRFARYCSLARGVFVGTVLLFAGFGFFLWILYTWVVAGFPDLNEVRLAIVALTTSVFGIQIIFSSFMLSILGLEKKS